jgi:hypothetical protein
VGISGLGLYALYINLYAELLRNMVLGFARQSEPRARLIYGSYMNGRPHNPTSHLVLGEWTLPGESWGEKAGGLQSIFQIEITAGRWVKTIRLGA